MKGTILEGSDSSGRPPDTTKRTAEVKKATGWLIVDFCKMNRNGK